MIRLMHTNENFHRAPTLLLQSISAKTAGGGISLVASRTRASASALSTTNDLLRIPR
jgi:hypothetical protein